MEVRVPHVENHFSYATRPDTPGIASVQSDRVRNLKTKADLVPELVRNTLSGSVQEESFSWAAKANSREPNLYEHLQCLPVQPSPRSDVGNTIVKAFLKHPVHTRMLVLYPSGGV
jgi:hypothetical protein